MFGELSLDSRRRCASDEKRGGGVGAPLDRPEEPDADEEDEATDETEQSAPDERLDISDSESASSELPAAAPAPATGGGGELAS